MPPSASVELFLLGLASGISVLTLTSYRRVSPAWLKWWLIATGVLLIGRYVVAALVTTAMEKGSIPLWLFYSCWLSRFIGLTLPAVFAVDQVIRHPAMTPQKLLRWYAPLLMVVAVALCLGNITLIMMQAVFFFGFAGVCLMLMRKIPSPPIQRVLFGLAFAYGYLGVDNSLFRNGDWSLRPSFSSEIVALLVLWYAYETSARLQQAS